MHGSVRNSTPIFQEPTVPLGLTVRPGFMRGCLLPELLSQVLHALQPPDLVQQPLLVALLRLLQPLPGARNVLGWLATSTAHPLCSGPPGLPSDPLCDVSGIFLGAFLSFLRPLYSPPTPNNHPHVLASKHLHYHLLDFLD